MSHHAVLAVAEASGLLAVTVMGIYLGNRKEVPIEEILEFKESLSPLLITVLLILLAARLEFAGLQTLGWGVVGVFLAIQFLARPIEVLYGTWASTLSSGERALLAAIPLAALGGEAFLITDSAARCSRWR